MNYTELIRVLYALVALQMSEKALPEADEILLSKGAKEVVSYLPELKGILNEYVKGNEVDLTGIGANLKNVLTKAARDPKATTTAIDLLKAFGLWFRVGSDAAFRKLEKRSVELQQPWLARLFAKELGSQKQLKTSLKKFIKTVVKRDGISLTLEEAQKLSKKAPVVYKEYLRLRREYNQVWKEALSTFVRTSGSNLVPMERALAFLKKNQIDHSLPLGFTGKIDASGAWYTNDGKLIKGVPSSVIFPKVKMNPRVDAENRWIFIAQKEDGTQGQYFYTQEHKSSTTEEKFKIANDLAKNIDSIRKKWASHIKDFDESDPRCAASLILEMLYVYSARIGGKGNSTAGKATFGISTLLVKQCRRLPDGGLRITYPGKKGVLTQHTLRNSSVPEKIRTKAFNFLLEDKARDDFVFTYRLKGGKRKPVTSSFVNAFFKQLGAGNATVHKLRTIIATKMMEEALEELYQKKKSFNNPKLFLVALQKVALSVGKTLNHMRTTKEGNQLVTGTTALQSYINPVLIAQAYEHYKIARPTWLEKLLAKQ